MPVEVYSAAKAIIFERGRTKEEVWNELTSIFNMKLEKRKRPTFIVNSHPLEKQIKKLSPEDALAGVGDTFKSHANYLSVTNWEPQESFAYVTEHATLNPEHIIKDKKTNMKSMMKFSLSDHPEGTIIEVIRKAQGDSDAWKKLKGIKVDPGEAEQLLRSVLERFYERKHYLNPGIQTTHNIHVERDDSLRNEF